jgi:hypothetical protein
MGGTRDLAFVLPIEVGGILVAHAIGGTGRVKVFAQHQMAGLLEPQRWAAGADAVKDLEQKAQRLLAQADAYRELSSSLAHNTVI